MTLEEEYRISCYEQLTKLSEDKEVYLVKNVENKKLYVKKKLSLYNKGIYERLSKERLENIPEIYLMIEDKDGLIVIEEYIHGQTLSEVLKEAGTIDERKSVEIITNILTILDKLHNMEPAVIHRDIKPQNIMISNDGIVKLIDFNASRRLGNNSEHDTYFMGTVGYAAPEQYGFGQSDSRTDIYACGIMLNVMLTGKFPREKLYEGAIGKIIEKCTRLEQAMRYQSVKELMKELENVNNLNQNRSERNSRKINNVYNGVEENCIQGKYDGFGQNNHINEESQEKHYIIKDGKADKTRIRKWMPVGFRTFVWWKCLLAVIGYAGIIKITVATEWHDAEGNLMGGAELFINWATELILLIGYVFYIGNYAGIRNKLKHFHGKKVINMVLDVLYLVIFTITLIMILVIVEIILF